jgi:hypothetical protein
MTAVLLAVHVLAAIVFIGPVTVAASLFPRYARQGEVGVARVLHRISRVYAVLGVAVPVFGIATAAQMGVLGDVWLLVSLALTLVAALLLAVEVLPGQTRVLAALTGPMNPMAAPAVPSRLAMSTGVFALIWAVVVVLMIVRPGSTTGVGA